MENRVVNSSPSKMDKKLISIVLPIFNEERVLEILYQHLNSALSGLKYDFELIFVNDGSTDGSLGVLISLRERDRQIKIIDLSRNFGHQNALTAGIDYSRGAAVILMDADLEDNPDYIPSFIENWAQGYAVVYAKRSKRQVSFFRNICFTLFHKINRIISRVPIDTTGIFCLMDRKVVEHLKNMTEKDKYIPGLRSWIGFKQRGIEVVRDARYDSRSRVRFRGLFKLALDSFTSFSTAPLKVAMFLGLLFSLLSMAGFVFIVILKFFQRVPVPGWTSIVSIILLSGGVQLICLWLQGEYMARIFSEVKNRPNYIVNDMIGFD